MNNLDNNFITGILKRATDILFVFNPKMTSMGIVFGVFIKGLTVLLKPILDMLKDWVEFTNVGFAFWIAFGIFLFNLPSLFRQQRLDPQLEAALAAIAAAQKEGRLTLPQARLLYIALFEKALDQVTSYPSTSEQRGRIQ